MSYDYDLLLKCEYKNSYTLMTLDGIVLHHCRAIDLYHAMKEAENFASSWHSVRIRTEEEYEQDKKRDRVPESTTTDDAPTGQHTNVPEAGELGRRSNNQDN